MFKRLATSLAALVSAYAINTASADTWHSESRFVLTTGMNAEPAAGAFGFEYHDGFRNEMGLKKDFSLYGHFNFDLTAAFTKKLYIFNVGFHYALKTWEKHTKGLEGRTFDYALHLGSGVGGFALGEKLKRGDRNPLDNALIYAGPTAELTITTATEKDKENFLSIRLGTYGGAFLEGSNAFLLSLRLNEEKRLNTMWGLGITSETIKVLNGEKAGLSFLEVVDTYAKVKLKKKIDLISLPDKYAFGLRYTYFDGFETRHMIQLLGAMEL